MLFRGSAPALVTPFTDEDQVDEAAFKQLIDDQIEGGVDALVVLGTTGENPTISPKDPRHARKWSPFPLNTPMAVYRSS